MTLKHNKKKTPIKRESEEIFDEDNFSWKQYYQSLYTAIHKIGKEIDHMKITDEHIIERLHDLDIHLRDLISTKCEQLHDKIGSNKEKDAARKEEVAVELAKIKIRISWQAPLFGGLAGGLILLLSWLVRLL